MYAIRSYYARLVMKSKKIKNKKTDIICMIIAFVCFSIGGALVVFCGVDTRITSYNVCYTKLLRSALAARTGFRQNRLDFIQHLANINATVITSYSIHYTKLYDPWASSSALRWNAHRHFSAVSTLKNASPDR